LDRAEQKEPAVAEMQTKNLKEKVQSLKKEMERTKRVEAEVLETPEK